MNILTLAITTAVSAKVVGKPLQLNRQPHAICAQANFTYGSGGATVTCWLQTSLDSGVTWTDIAVFTFATSSARQAVNVSASSSVLTPTALTDGTLTGNAQDGLVGAQFRCKTTSTGTYAGTTLAVDVQCEQLAGTP